jgi:hypothetical protein
MTGKRREAVTIELAKAFYGRGPVEHTARRFGRVCGIETSEKAGHYEVRFTGLPREDLEEVSLEFANQVLFFTKTGV